MSSVDPLAAAGPTGKGLKLLEQRANLPGLRKKRHPQ
jgi:hypothetical protein